MTHEDVLLYLFLVLVADKNGVSFYRKEKIGQAMSLEARQLEVAKDRLINLKLIAFESYSALSPNGYYQVLPIDSPAPEFGCIVNFQTIPKPLTATRSKNNSSSHPINRIANTPFNRFPVFV